MLRFVSMSFLADIDECSSRPCSNGGTCIDRVNRYICHCRTGYTGKICEKGNYSAHNFLEILNLHYESLVFLKVRRIVYSVTYKCIKELLLIL